MTTPSLKSSAPPSTLFSRALKRASQCFDLPTIDEKTQSDLRAALDDLKELAANVESLGIFSPNETIEDISTRDLVYLFVPFVQAQLYNRIATPSPRERLGNLTVNQSLLQAFTSALVHYEVVPIDERKLLEITATSVRDPAKRREIKIQQYKKEKELKGEIETLRKRRSQTPTNIKNDFDYIDSLLPSSSDSAEDEDDENEHLLRTTTLVLLRLFFVQAHSQLESLQQELELLRSMPERPPSPPQPDAREVARQAEEDRWRLDKPLPAGGIDGKGPLLDSSGRPLRPFTILPAGESANRARLQAQVFRADHRLPTMSIDEYLEVERERGNIITGGGPQSEEQLTSSEQLALDTEMDGSAFAEARAEEKRLKDEQWAMFTEANPRGSGNTMNRG